MISSDPDLLRSVLWFWKQGTPQHSLALKLHHSISELFSNIHAIPSSYEIAVQNRTMVIIVERFVESDKAEKMLRGLVEQMMNVEPVVLRTSMLSVSFMGENGEGPGPVAELFGSYLPRTLFTNPRLAPPFIDRDPRCVSGTESGGIALFEKTANGDYFWPVAGVIQRGWLDRRWTERCQGMGEGVCQFFQI